LAGLVANYLLSLQQRVKWNEESPNLTAGTVVAPETISGADGKVRVAIVKTKNGIYKRASIN